MKVIHEGKIPVYTYLEGCPECGSTFTFTRGEALHWRGKKYIVRCPVCNVEIAVRVDKQHRGEWMSKEAK